jgi:hypothetical protein
LITRIIHKSGDDCSFIDWTSDAVLDSGASNSCFKFQTESEVEKEEESETDIFKVNNKDELAALTSADPEKEFAPKQAEPELKVAARKPKQEKEAASKQAKQKMDKSVDMEQEVVAKAVSRSRRKLTSSSSPETQGNSYVINQLKYSFFEQTC